MEIKLICMGKSVEPWLVEGMGLYIGRLKHYCRFSLIEIPELKQTSALSTEQIKEREGALILKQIAPSDHLVLLDEHGKELRSISWARDLEERMIHDPKDIVFVIGGSYGFCDTVYKRANAKLSLSQMTFSHQIIRVIFLEQLYRAFTIIKGEPYHHE
ncbi:MAG: 23S rRNA (pseudouridine(1915)-N(3))-methyltransferase RlmH [Bacteroidales bacterium]|nr:23S rRNA (pseudouridine(1915)-N(3))-methyltransferase RlmH [Bacteroidales bacterium]